jgi:hypothetical protein
MKGGISNGPTLQRWANGHTDEATCRCPVCQSVIEPEKLASIVGALSARETEIEQMVAAKFTRQLVDARKTKRGEIAKAVREATTALRDGQEAAIAASVATEREKAGKAVADAVSAAKLEYAAEKLKLETQLSDMQRRLQAKTPHALGEPNEVALHRALVEAFTEDQCRINRVPKGRAGVDIVIDVLEHGTTIGTIAIDSKNYTRWSSKFLPKLKSDARAISASWSILATNVFPKESTRGLCVVDSIIVADHGYVPALVEVLRRQIIALHRQRITQEARDEKATALLDFVASPECADLLAEFGKISDGLLDLDVREVTSHQTVWRKRGELIRSFQRTQEQLIAEIDRIVTGSEPVAAEVSV